MWLFCTFYNLCISSRIRVHLNPPMHEEQWKSAQTALTGPERYPRLAGFARALSLATSKNDECIPFACLQFSSTLKGQATKWGVDTMHPYMQALEANKRCNGSLPECWPLNTSINVNMRTRDGRQTARALSEKDGRLSLVIGSFKHMTCIISTNHSILSRIPHSHIVV